MTAHKCPRVPSTTIDRQRQVLTNGPHPPSINGHKGPPPALTDEDAH
jgi:hypothetical protein